MRTSNGIQYPDTIAMAFAPVLFVSTDNDVVRLEVTLTNGEGASVTVSHDAFGGVCYVDMSDYVQGMYGDVSMPEDGTMRKSPMMKMMTYSVRKLTSAWSLAVDGAQTYFVWGAAARGETWGGNRYYRRSYDMPFTLDLLKLGTQSFQFSGGGQTASVTASSVGLWHVPIPQSMQGVERILVADSLGTAVIVMDDCNDGLVLRWIDRHGLLVYRAFYKGVRASEIGNEGEYKRNNLLNWNEDYGWKGMTGAGWIKTRKDKMTVCAYNVTEEEYAAMQDLASSPLVEMMAGDDEWMTVSIDAGTWQKKSAALQEMEFDVIFDDVPIQRA